MGEMIKTSVKLCKTCKYYKRLSNGITYCDYLCITGSRRGCKCGECNKYDKKKEE